MNNSNWKTFVYKNIHNDLLNGGGLSDKISNDILDNVWFNVRSNNLESVFNDKILTIQRKHNNKTILSSTLLNL